MSMIMGIALQIANLDESLMNERRKKTWKLKQWPKQTKPTTRRLNESLQSERVSDYLSHGNRLIDEKQKKAHATIIDAIDHTSKSIKKIMKANNFLIEKKNNFLWDGIFQKIEKNEFEIATMRRLKINGYYALQNKTLKRKTLIENLLVN